MASLPLLRLPPQRLLELANFFDMPAQYLPSLHCVSSQTVQTAALHSLPAPFRAQAQCLFEVSPLSLPGSLLPSTSTAASAARQFPGGPGGSQSRRGFRKVAAASLQTPAGVPPPFPFIPPASGPLIPPRDC